MGRFLASVRDAVRLEWQREQQLLGLARETADGAFLMGGLGALAENPSVRITVLPADVSSRIVALEEPKKVLPQYPKLPRGHQVQLTGTARGSASGYVAYSPGDNGKWRSFCAVAWHGGVDFFPGEEAGRLWRLGRPVPDRQAQHPVRQRRP
jgi:hypothetical protein